MKWMNLPAKSTALSQYSLTVLIGTLCFSSIQTEARIFRIGMYPNGSANQCAACHVNPSGGGTRTPFGEDVYAIVKGSSQTPFWSPTLAKKDSDGDGFTNGQEVGDPQGSGKAYSGVQVTNPGVSSSKPTLKAPQVTITNFNSGTYTVPYSGIIQVAAKANAGEITKVEILDGSSSLASLTTAPFDFSLNLTNAGTYVLSAKATDYLGASATSQPITLELKAEAPATPIILTGIQSVGDTLTLSWAGGVGPYIIQWNNQINSSNWNDVLTTTNLSATVQKTGQTGFYRLAEKR